MIHYYVLDEVLDKIKEIADIEIFGDTKRLIDTEDKLSYIITLKDNDNDNML